MFNRATVYRCAFLVLLSFLPACNSSKPSGKTPSVSLSAEQGKAAQPAPSQPPAAQPTAAHQPTQKQEQKNITFAKNPGMFVKQETTEPQFNITNPKTAQEHFNVAVNYDHQNRLDQAIGEYQKALELKSDWAVAHFRIAQDYQKQGRTDEAITHWELATRYDPQFYSAYDLLSAAYEREGNLPKAIEAYSALLNYPPTQMPAHYQLGIWYAQLGDNSKAREHLQAYRELALKSKSIEAQSERFQKASQELQKLKQ
jgi:tetratricopeptide (TPR) repeat protein